MPMGCCFPFPCPRCKCNEPKIQAEPLYTDYLYVLNNEDPTVGLNGVDWHGTMYPNLMNHKEYLVYRFLKHYQLREITRENVNQWMLLLQDRFDEIADRYNHAFKLYDDETVKLDDFGIGYLREIWTQGSGSGNSSSESSATNTSKFRDTPTNGNSTINNPTTENVDSSSGSSGSSSSRSSSGYSKEKYDYNDRQVMEEVNDLVDKYKQLSEKFIYEFNEMFIGILAKWC
jgi:hypothetical protein